MKKLLIVPVLVFLLFSPCFGYHIEVLQVANIGAYDDTHRGLLEELARNGIVEGQNLTINRQIIEASADANLWKKVGILLKIKSAASRIVDAKPDLVITVGTPATRYSMDKIIGAGIPVVFSCVANPPVLGCPSVTEPLPGLTGVTLYQDPLNYLVLAQMAKPDIKNLGMIYSDDDNAVAFNTEVTRKASQLGINMVTREVGKSDPLTPAALELIKAGVDSFAIPLDAYYGLRNQEHGKELLAVASEYNLPVFCFVNYDDKGALLYAGADFNHMGVLSGRQAAAILKEGKRPEELPILAQKDLQVFIDRQIAEKLGIELSEQLLQVAKER
ncbi:MAG TPA: ABC transporter substrate-binding protein [Deltaproteobacteria bacterium]|nr:ABC transporter substrate-binding protein [Deltaproteobacteria bacterium]